MVFTEMVILGLIGEAESVEYLTNNGVIDATRRFQN